MSLAAYKNIYLKSDQYESHPRNNCFWQFQWRPEPSKLVYYGLKYHLPNSHPLVVDSSTFTCPAFLILLLEQ